jgi:hypothetical protein
MQCDKKCDIQIAMTMPIDTSGDKLFPCSTLERMVKGRARDSDEGTTKVKRKEAMSLFPMLIEYNRV